jgi:hypothetical protein
MGERKMRFRATEVATLLVAVIALVGTIASSFYTYSNRNRELDIELVKLGVAILRADPNKETQTRGAREWAINVIETFSGVRFTGTAKAELLSNKYSGIGGPLPLPAPGKHGRLVLPVRIHLRIARPYSSPSWQSRSSNKAPSEPRRCAFAAIYYRERASGHGWVI